ncbi:MAG: hypothetical protein H6737_03780 [Alphaproteobacteria bacterium]|nr:hypothetical protein [Alphaproteobacteria bacterium]
MWALVLPALAGFTASLTAEVRRDGTIRGTLTVPPGTEVVDPLARLPDAPDDLNQLRTFPGAPDRGEMRFTEESPGTWAFETRLPKRFGGIGHTAHGTYASGGFYPQPLVDGEVPETTWTVQIRLPGDALGVVGTTVGTGTLAWEGRSDRVLLALPRRARVESVQAGDTAVTLVGKGRPRRALVRAARTTLAEVRLGEPEVVLVEAPLRRRLVRPSHGVALVSDRIFRLFPAFQSYHDHGFAKGVATAASPHPDAMTRELDGAIRAAQWKAARKGAGATGITRAFSWVPQIDYLLSSRRIAFYSELFEEVHSGDPVQDDLVEMLSPRRHGASVRVQLDDRYGPGTSETVNQALHEGLDLSQALQYAGADPHLAAGWREPIPAQDYVLDIGPETATVTRVAEPGAPPETVLVRTDEGRVPLTLLPGESVTMKRPEHIRIDPERHALQTSRARDSWPQRPIRVVATAFIDNLNLTRFRVSGSGALYVRGRYDTKNLFSGSLYSSRASLVGVTLSYTRKFGPLKDGISRQHRLRFAAGPRIIDPAFLSEEDGPLSTSASLSYAYDTRVSSDFPLRGRRLSLSVGGGTFPGTASRWASAGISATAITSPHPRHAIAVRASADIARASREDQLLTLGGLGAMRSLPVLRPCYGDADPCADVAREAVFGALEYRVAPLRGMSVPLGVAWWTELQVTAGLEATAGHMLAGDASALGATLGIGGIGDIAGAEPSFLGLTGGWLLWQDGLGYAEPLRPVPEIYLLWTQAF